MSTVWIVPAGTDTAPDAQSGDYLLRPDGDTYEVGRVGDTCTWLGSLSADLLPPLPAATRRSRRPSRSGSCSRPAGSRARRSTAAAEPHLGG